MLVLTRKIQESVIVGEDHGPQRMLKVTVLAIRGDRVKLGFEVDTAIKIRRSEVWQRIRDSAIADDSTGSLDAFPTVRSERRFAAVPTLGVLGPADRCVGG